MLLCPKSGVYANLLRGCCGCYWRRFGIELRSPACAIVVTNVVCLVMQRFYTVPKQHSARLKEVAEHVFTVTNR
jgi:hypothetical protein